MNSDTDLVGESEFHDVVAGGHLDGRHARGVLVHEQHAGVLDGALRG